ncbi:hypothetical protein BSKO_10913 [Bryopsis sp. KO-2023]|nr:hypothetical protein BSKO_10913 [Bryopsis sp. KO-2023]
MTASALVCFATVVLVSFSGILPHCCAQDFVGEAETDVVTFKVGALFAPKSGEKARERAEESRKGYQYLVEEVNRRGFTIEWRSHARTLMRFELVEFYDAEELWANTESLHFLLGAEGLGAQEAEIEAKAAWAYRTILVRCCSPENVSRFDHDQHIFDVRPYSGRYPELALRSFALQSIRRYEVVSDVDDEFYKKACKEAVRVIEDFNEVVQDKNQSYLEPKVFEKSKMGLESRRAYFSRVAQSSLDNDVEAVVACVDEKDGELLVEAFDELRYPLKAFFLTDGPTNPNWVKKLGALSTDLLTATQLTETSTLKDDFFKRSRHYITAMKKRFGQDYIPTSTAAAASTSAYLLVSALHKAFSECDPIHVAPLDPKDLLNSKDSLVCDGNRNWPGSQYIIQYLLDLDMDTFIGKVNFDRFWRNNQYPFTIQVDDQLKTNIVLPAAAKPLRLPAKNRYISACRRGERITTNRFSPCEACPAGYYSDRENSPECSQCDIGHYSSSPGATACVECPEHTTTKIKGSLSVAGCECLIGYFNPFNRTGEACLECPFGADCAGGRVLPRPNAGYWSNETKLEMYQCDPPSHCLVGGECAAGLEGTLCTRCKEGHFKLIDNCLGCPGKGPFALLIILLYIGWYMLNVVISGSMASLDMLLSFAQLANVIGDVGLGWPSRLETTFGVTNILDFDLDILWPSCLISDWSYANNFYVQLIFPLVMGLMAMFGYFLAKLLLYATAGRAINIRKRTFRWSRFLVFIPVDTEELDEKWDTTIAAFVAAIEVSYVTVTKYLFDAFKCETIAGKTVLSASPDIECGSRTHASMVLAAIIGILFYSVGYLLFVGIKLFHLHINRAFAVPQNIRRYGFIYKRFEPGYVWMSMFILARRLAFVAVLVFMQSPAFQAAALALLTTASLMVHVYTAPYVDTYLDVLFSFLLVALMFETFGGLMFYSENLPSKDRDIMEWFVVAVIVLVGLVFLVIFAMEVKKKYYLHVLRRIHVDAVLNRRTTGSKDSGNMDAKPTYRIKTERHEVSDELFQTFQPEFLYRGLLGWDEGLMDWDRLTDKLQGYMSDGSETSYLSTKNIARFWRKLVDKFPELIDFLAITDDVTRTHFVEFTKGLYTNYFLKKRVDSLQIYRVLNWRDRAPLAQWLSMCPESDRQFFTVFMAGLFHRAQGENASDELVRKVNESGSGWFHQHSFPSSSMSSSSQDDEGASGKSRALINTTNHIRKISASSAQALWLMKSYRESSIRQEIQLGHGPLFHSAASALESIVEINTSSAASTTSSSHQTQGEGVSECPSPNSDCKMEGDRDGNPNLDGENKPPAAWPREGVDLGRIVPPSPPRRFPKVSLLIGDRDDECDPGQEDIEEADTPKMARAKDFLDGPPVVPPQNQLRPNPFALARARRTPAGQNGSANVAAGASRSISLGKKGDPDGLDHLSMV